MMLFENWDSRATIEYVCERRGVMYHKVILTAWYKGNPSDPFFKKEYKSDLSARRALNCLDRSGGKWHLLRYC